MNKLSVIKTPHLPILNENFVYNYYSEKEKTVDDRKLVVFDEEEEYYAIRTNNANNIVAPRYITFDIDVSKVNDYNIRSIDFVNRNVVETQAINEITSKISSFGDKLDTREESYDNLFLLSKRREYFNSINKLCLNQVTDNEIDLTLNEDLSEPYKQMIDLLDIEDPSRVIPEGGNENFINYSLTKNSDTFAQFKQSQKNGDSTIINRNFFSRIKQSNRKFTTSYLEDKQSESIFNLSNISKNNQIQASDLNSFIVSNFRVNSGNFFEIARQINTGQVLFNGAVLGLSNNEEIGDIEIQDSLIDAVLESAESSRRNLFDNIPRSLIETVDFMTDSENFVEINELVIGFLIDKYEVKNNRKSYLCSKFYKLNSFAKDSIFSVIDYAVNYDKTYAYEARPVHVQSYVRSQDDIPERVYYLVLGNRSSSYGIKCIERESPLPPSYLELSYDINNKGINLKWGLPANRQRDIFNFQIFRRESPFEPFKLIKEFRKKNIRVLDNSGNIETPLDSVVENTDFMKFNFLDKNIINNKVYIYAVCCVDAHGLSSAYSAQVAGKFNGLTSNLEVDTISLAGALKQYPNQFFHRKTKFYNFENDVISNTPIIKNKSKMNVFFTPDYRTIKKENERIKIIDLDTDEDDINTYSNYFSISLTDINTLKTAKQNIYIQDRET